MNKSFNQNRTETQYEIRHAKLVRRGVSQRLEIAVDAKIFEQVITMKSFKWPGEKEK